MSVPSIRLLDARGRPLVNQSYEAAGQGHRATHWVAPSSGPNRALSYGLTTLRNRARAAYRNNP
jgi:capsid protein